MPLTDDIIRRLVATPYGRSQLDLILSANPGLAPNLSQGPDPAETGVPTRPRPLLTTLPQATQATAPTAGFMPQPVSAPPADVLQAAASSPMGSNFMPEVKTREPEPASSSLFDRVKDFFGSSDDKEDEATDPYDQDVSSRAWAGAAAAAAQTASDWRASPVQVLTNALSGYGTAKAKAKEDLRKEAQQERLFGLKERELETTIKGQEGVATRAARDDARQQQQLERLYAAGNNLPEGPLRDRFNMLIDINETGEAAKLLNPDPAAYDIVSNSELGVIAINKGDPTDFQQLVPGTPKQPEIHGDATSGYFIMTPDGPKTVRPGIGFAPQAPREAPETWHLLSKEEVKTQGLPEGTLMEISSRGATRIPYKPTTQTAGVTLTNPDGTTVQIGGSGQEGVQAVKLPQNFYMGEASDEAKNIGITQKVATPVVGSTDYAKAIGTIQSSTKFMAKLNKIEEIFSKYGTQILPGSIKGELTSLANDAKLDYAQAKGQGALQKTDDAVIGSVLGAITDPSMVLPGGHDQVLAQIRQAKSSVDQDLDGLLLQYPWANVRTGPTGKKKETKQEAPATAPVSVPTVPSGPPPAGVPTIDTPASILDEVGIQ